VRAKVVRWIHLLDWKKFMKTLFGVAFSAVPLLAVGVALAQNANVTNGDNGMWTSGYGGIGVAILVAIVVAGLVAVAMRYRVK
jgi:hypothetical protein